jgi:hypothetical protein
LALSDHVGLGRLEDRRRMMAGAAVHGCSLVAAAGLV